MLPYFDEADLAITICDKEGKILEMNQQSISVNQKGEESLIGKNILDCHPEPAKSLLLRMMANEEKHVYTIEKMGKKKLIYQIPWYETGEYMGFIELSMVIPFEMEHKVRTPKTQP